VFFKQGANSGGLEKMKKFVLKPWKTAQSLDKPQAVELWLKLRSAIERIYNQEVSQLLFEELYR